MRLAESSFRSVARSLAIDLVTAEVVTAFREAAVESVLLRGPAIARRIYTPGELRPYVDVDLLVAPRNEDAAGRVLRELGFAVIASESDLAGFRPVHAHEWLRQHDGGVVDLHRTVSGVGIDGSAFFSILLADSDPELVAGTVVNMPSVVAVALQTSLHAAHHGPRRTRSRHDLEHALERLPLSVWRDAARLAEEVEAVPAFVAGLGLTAAGARLATFLDLDLDAPPDVRLRASSPPPLALGIDWLARTHGVRSKARLLVRTLVPSPGALRTWRPLARRRPFGLLLAYASQPLWLAWHTVPSLRAVRRARKEAG